MTMMTMVMTHLARLQPEVHESDVDALSLRNFDQPRPLICAAPSRLERRQTGDATGRCRQTDLSRLFAAGLRLRRDHFQPQYGQLQTRSYYRQRQALGCFSVGETQCDQLTISTD